MNYYNSYSQYLKERFGCKVYKVPVSIGAGCPNREGTLTGCTYCDHRGSASPIIEDPLPLNEQIENGIAWAQKKYHAEKFIVYLQPFTNTYVPLQRLHEALETSLQFESVVGIAIGTRPDCVPEEVMNLVASFAQKTEVWLELGLQTVHHRTLKAIKRGHSLASFIDAIIRAKKAGDIRIAAHIIIGLPGESREEIIETARVLSVLPIDGIKIHLLHILKGSELAEEFEHGNIDTLTLPQYASLVTDVIEHLRPDIIIQRITAEAESKHLIAPIWCLDKLKVINAIHDEFEKRKTHQGKKYRLGLSMDQIERRTLESIPSELGRDKRT